MKSTVLLVDDDPVDGKALQLLLESWDFEVQFARSGDDALNALCRRPVDVVLSDVRMPGMSGEDLMDRILVDHPGIPIILITGRGDIKSAVRAMKRGATDYVTKPPDEEELRLTLERALDHSRLQRENEFLRAELAAGGMYGERLVGRSPRMLELYELVNRVAKTDSTVLITGETGTGKELVAQTVHYRSDRSGMPLVALNCASLNSNLVESELFGHEKGAFTGAVAGRHGRFEDANGGTLFLDEISETSIEFQAKLLRVLQDGEMQRVGGNKNIRVDVRLIASTNRDLEEAVKEGRFREDLLYRLRVIPIHLPALRERREDIPLLAAHFLSVYTQRYSAGVQSISEDAMERLSARQWKGNVRELQHTIERAVVLARHDVLDSSDFEEQEREEQPPDSGENLHAFVDRVSRDHIVAVLDRTQWRKQKAADLLGIDRATLYRLIQKHSIAPDVTPPGT